MAEPTNSMIFPPIEGLLERAGSKFSLVTISARRARDINSYYRQLGDALGQFAGPQVTSTARKPLSIAFEELAEDKVEGVGGATGREIPASMLPVVEVEGSDDVDAVLPAGPDGAED